MPHLLRRLPLLYAWLPNEPHEYPCPACLQRVVWQRDELLWLETGVCGALCHAVHIRRLVSSEEESHGRTL